MFLSEDRDENSLMFPVRLFLFYNCQLNKQSCSTFAVVTKYAQQGLRALAKCSCKSARAKQTARVIYRAPVFLSRKALHSEVKGFKCTYKTLIFNNKFFSVCMSTDRHSKLKVSRKHKVVSQMVSNFEKGV